MARPDIPWPSDVFLASPVRVSGLQTLTCDDWGTPLAAAIPTGYRRRWGHKVAGELCYLTLPCYLGQDGGQRICRSPLYPPFAAIGYLVTSSPGHCGP